MKQNNKQSLKSKKNDQPTPISFGQGIVNITNLIGTEPDFTTLTKPTQNEKGYREFLDSKGTFFEMKKDDKDKTTVSE